MAYVTFLEYLPYSVGDVVAYGGGVYVFMADHLPGVWDPSQVVQINQTSSYPTADFNTLPNYNLSSPLAAPKYRVNYYVNNEDLVIFDAFPVDTEAYLPGAPVTILGYDYIRFSQDGVWAYHFTGWAVSKGSFELVSYVADTEVTMGDHDINLYAQWEKVATITVDVNAKVSIKTEYKDALHTIYIPEYFNGTRIKTIRQQAFYESSIEEIVIPPSITLIEMEAFEDWTGSVLRFIDSEITDKYPVLYLEKDCFNLTPNLVEILIPYRWRDCDGPIFPSTAKSGPLNIKIRNSQTFMSDLLNWDERGYADVIEMVAEANNPSLNYTRIITWGYND